MSFALDVLFYLTTAVAVAVAVARVLGYAASPALGRACAWLAPPLFAAKAYFLLRGGAVFVDFGAFWRGGADVLAGRDPYAGVERPEGMLILSPMTALPVFAVMALFPQGVSGWALFAANVATSVALVELARRALNAQAGEAEETFPRAAVAGLAAALVFSNGCRVGAMVGNLHAVTAAAVVVALWAQGRGRPVLAGLALAVASVKPQTMLPFLILFLRKRDLPSWAALVVGVLALTFSCTRPADLPVRVREMSERISYLSVGGRFNDYTYTGPYHASIINLEHALYGLGLRDRGVIKAVQFAALGALGGGLAWLTLRRRPRISRPAACALTACFTMLFLYHRVYDSVILALPLVFATARARSTGGRTRALYVTSALACLVGANVFWQLQLKLLGMSWGLGPLGGWAVRAFVVPYATWAILLALVSLGFAVALDAPETAGVGPGPRPAPVECQLSR